MVVLDIRGTHGSGKSWVVHKLLETLGAVDITEGSKKIGHLVPSRNCAVLGRYDRVCGGCDGIATADEVVSRLRTFADQYRHVVLEGILVAHTFKRYNALALEMETKGRPYYFAFLDTPLDLCVERVRARRESRGQGKPFDPKNVVKDWHGVWGRVRRQCLEGGRRVLVLDHRSPLPTIMEVLLL